MERNINPYEKLIDNFLKNEFIQDKFSDKYIDFLNPNNNLIASILRKEEFQDRFGFYDKDTDFQYSEKGSIKKDKILRNEELLIDFINIYDTLCSLEEDEDELKSILSNYNLTKEGVLSFLKKNYPSQLKTLKLLGGDISEYPKTLEDLTN